MNNNPHPAPNIHRSDPILQTTEEKQKAAAARAEQKMLRRIHREKKKAVLREYPSFSVTKHFIWYAAFWIFSLLFTQALRSPLSSMLFIFVIMLPFLLLLYVLTGIPNLRQSSFVAAETTQKETPVDYEILLANDSFLPYPFVEADILYPSKDGVRCEGRRISCSLVPTGVFQIKDQAVFHYRGQYEIGVKDIYVYDILKLFRIRLRQNNLQPVFVMPRRLFVSSDGQGAASEVNTTEVRNMRGADRTELTEIREYQLGDGLRDIHWKLSSKTQDLMVKHYGMNACRSIYFLPDLADAYQDPLQKGYYETDINLFCADAVTEMTIALMLSALRTTNNICSLLWYDRRAVGTIQETDHVMGYAAEVMYNELDFERVYPAFATAALHAPSYSPASLCRFITETESVSYGVITSRLDIDLIKQLQENIRNYSTVILNGGLSLYYFSPLVKIKDPSLRQAKEEEDERRISQFRASGILVHCFESLS